MVWTSDSPKFGDIIRIELSPGLYHYGIYVSDDEVIAFGLPPIGGFSVPSEEIKVISSDIDKFFCGRFVEVAKLGFIEKLKAKKPNAVVAYARSRIGDGGYHIVKNNCEHFVYECVFGVKKSLQADASSGAIKSMTPAFVYIAEIPIGMDTSAPLFPPERMSEMQKVKNERVFLQKYAAWKTLTFALSDALSTDITKTNIHKEPGGFWALSGAHISLSHTDNLVAIAVSTEHIGVDIEKTDREVNAAAIKKGMTKQEEKLYAERNTNLDLLKLWTKKESAFKRLGEETFKPNKINTVVEDIHTFVLNGFSAVLSVATDAGKIELFEVNSDFSSRTKADYTEE
ncbi:MAG: lecithin retinol acyltransferase family protein [Clostridiales bacterium]|nr:lecithin retinol acyltransferase family protein [Clostridiales bacterium]